MATNFEQFQVCIPEIEKFTFQKAHENFFKEEAIRFYSIAGTLLNSFQNTDKDITERMLSHIWLRSVIENYFWLLYFYDNVSDREIKFDAYLNGFKKEYAKLYNELLPAQKTTVETPDQSWSQLTNPMDLRSVLAQLKNNNNDRLEYIYFIYRISSFDTHGKSLKSLFDASFNKECNFPYLKLDPVLELIADQYLFIWNEIKPK